MKTIKGWLNLTDKTFNHRLCGKDYLISFCHASGERYYNIIVYNIKEDKKALFKVFTKRYYRHSTINKENNLEVFKCEVISDIQEYLEKRKVLNDSEKYLLNDYVKELLNVFQEDIKTIFDYFKYL